MDVLLEILGTDFMRCALLASGLLAVQASFLGTLVVLRRIVFVAVAIAQCAALGVAVSLVGDWEPVPFSFLGAAVAVLVLFFSTHSKRVSSESMVGFLYVFTMALSVVVLSKGHHGTEELMSLVSADILTISPTELNWLEITTAVLVGFYVLFHRQIVLVSYDSDSAQSQGVSAHWWNLTFYLTLGAAIAVAVKVVGILMVFGLILLPPMTACMFSGTLRSVVFLSLVVGVLGSTSGLVLSVVWDIPSAPAVVGVLGVVAVVALGLRTLIRDA